MKSICLTLFVRTLIFSFFAGSTAFAVEICATDTSDPDGDGWGWEDNTSCRVGPYNPVLYPECESSASDSDGDGWGWEQGQTCLVDTAAAPGLDFDSAGLVMLDEEFGSRAGASRDHFYKFEVAELTGVTASFDAGQPGNYDYSILDEDGGHLWDGLLSLEAGACLAKGTYYFSVNHFFYEDGETDDYTATLNSIDLNCASPAAKIDLSHGDWWAGTDGAFYRSFTDIAGVAVLAKLDAAGAVLWSVVASDFITSVESVESGVLVFTYNDVQLLDSLGNQVWRFETIFVQPETTVTGATTLVVNEQFEYTVFSINLDDGSLRWRYDYSSNDFIEISRVADDGKVTLKTADSFLFFD